MSRLEEPGTIGEEAVTVATASVERAARRLGVVDVAARDVVGSLVTPFVDAATAQAAAVAVGDLDGAVAIDRFRTEPAGEDLERWLDEHQAAVEAAHDRSRQRLDVVGAAAIWGASATIAVLWLLRVRTVRLLASQREQARVERLLDEVRDVLAAGETGFRLLFERNPQPMWVMDVETLRFLEVNAAAQGHYGWTREEFLAMTALDIRPGAERARLLTELEQRTVQPREAGRWIHRRADGSEVVAEITSHRMTFQGRAALLVLSRDVTEQQRLEDELRYRAEHDTLTDLPNREVFRARTDQAIASLADGELAAVVLFDLDRFKSVNDSLGHDVGDRLLSAVAERLRATAAAGDVLARLGGDEFAVLVAGAAHADDVVARARRLLDVIAEPVPLDRYVLHVRASAGIATAQRGRSAQELLRNADLAMYQAKDRGGHDVCAYEEAMHRRASARLALESDLARAVEAGDLTLLYQPVVHLGRNDVAGCEALLRWTHPVRGPVSPAEFIPIAEVTGDIVAIGAWVLEEACRQTVAWNASRPLAAPLRINVNLSPRQLHDPDLLDVVAGALDRAGLEPDLLVLEVTESIVVGDTADAIERLTALRELGVRVALDDFGTGYSSLRYLQQLPIQQLKIDRGFIEPATSSARGLALLRDLIRLGRGLGLEILAEGIETTHQAALLSDLGAHLAQGYLFARPLAPADVDELLARSAAGLAWTGNGHGTRQPPR